VGEPANESHSRANATGVAGLRILVAEDVALNAEMLRYTLEQAGHTVHVVADGQQAIEAVGEAPFDMILMDVQMPVMDGLEATRAIRTGVGPQAAIPIVALTAYAAQEDLKSCLDAGMNDYLSKPLDRSKLHQVLARWGRPVHLESVLTASG
jgi:two-component system, sensor histidine kinase and response regulator